MMPSFADDPRPIGVFDSGVGGLTVLKALMRELPGQHFIYLGDTARVPYGTKSAETVRAYSLELARILRERHNVKMIVIACNTASAHAGAAIAAMTDAPVIGMIDTAAADAVARTAGRVLVMATQSTVSAQSYDRALAALKPGLDIRSVPCQVLVALAEEGWLDNDVADAAMARYIAPCFADEAARPDTVILGCTHFPLLKQSILRCAGPDIALIDTGEAAARHIVRHYGPFRAMTLTNDVRFYVTDAPERFKTMAQRFLGLPPATLAITHLDV